MSDVRRRSSSDKIWGERFTKKLETGSYCKKNRGVHKKEKLEKRQKLARSLVSKETGGEHEN